MTRVVADISMSLDGFVTGPDAGPELGLGRGGEALHNWAISSDDPVDRRIVESATARSGAVIMGRRLFDIVDGPDGWNESMGYGADQAATPPFFVVTHASPSPSPSSVRLVAELGLDVTFVTDGVAAAVAAARAAVGEPDRDVVVMGGGNVIAQCLAEGLLDALSLHLAPIVLGGGTPLFEGVPRRQLTQRWVEVSTTATHIVYDVST